MQTGQVKSGVLYSDQAARDQLYDTIEQMSREFAASVTRVLPALGEEIIVRDRIVRAQFNPDNRLVKEKQSIYKRYQSRIARSAIEMFGGQTSATGAPWAVVRGGALVYVQGQWELAVSPSFGYAVRIGLTPISLIRQSPFAGVQLQAGPMAVFPTPSSEIGIGILGSLHIGPKIDDICGPLLTIGLGLDAHVKAYRPRGDDEPQRYVIYGMTLLPLQRRYDPTTGMYGDPEFGGGFYLGFGARK